MIVEKKYKYVIAVKNKFKYTTMIFRDNEWCYRSWEAYLFCFGTIESARGQKVIFLWKNSFLTPKQIRQTWF